MAIAQSQPPVLWKQVLGLAAVQAAISLVWVMYGLYLPELLGQFGVSPQTALALLIVENGLAIALEPLMGRLSDQVQHWVGTRFPVIVVGVAIASGLFLLIPTLAILGNPGATMRVVVIVVLVAWAIALELAILAVPSGMVATHFDNRRVLCTGLLLSSVFAATVALSASLILMGATIALMLCLSLVLNSTIPFALSLVPSDKAGLAVGLYTGGVAASVSFFAFLYRQPEQITPGFGAVMVAIAFLIAACCVFIGRPQPIHQLAKL